MLRNFIFSLFFFTGIIIILIIFLPSLFLPKQVVLFGGKLMGHWTSFCLKFFLSTKIIIKGTENIIRDEKFFIAASHQSMFETFFLQTLFQSFCNSSAISLAKYVKIPSAPALLNDKRDSLTTLESSQPLLTAPLIIEYSPDT